jgi:hypothetical protein
MKLEQPVVNSFGSKEKLIWIDYSAESAFLNPYVYVENYSVFSGKKA